MARDELDAIRAGGKPSSDGMVAYWDTTKGYTDRGIGDVVVDIGPNRLDAKGYNRPVRAHTGYNWNGRHDCFRLAPHQYGGIEFHADAMIDSNRKATKTLEQPETLRSGAYAMRVRGGDGKGLAEEYIVFFVRPRLPKARIPLLFSTATYLAYANERIATDGQIVQPMAGQPPTMSGASLPTVSRFLDSTERHVFIDPGWVIDEDHAGVDLIRDAPPALEIARVDRAAKTVPGVVRDRYRGLLVWDYHHGGHRSKEFFVVPSEVPVAQNDVGSANL